MRSMTKEWREEVLDRYDRDAAILKILKVLNSRMAVMSKPMRDEALTLAVEHGIIVNDLIIAWKNIAEKS